MHVAFTHAIKSTKLMTINICVTIIIICATLASCSSFGPHTIAFTNQYSGIESADNAPAVATAEACDSSLFWIFNWGDSSIEKAIGELKYETTGNKLAYIVADRWHGNYIVYFKHCTIIRAHTYTDKKEAAKRKIAAENEKRLADERTAAERKAVSEAAERTREGKEKLEAAATTEALKQGVWTDNKAHLAWQLSAEKHTMNHFMAKAYCNTNEPNLPGNGWRLPSPNELETYYNASTLQLDESGTLGMCGMTTSWLGKCGRYWSWTESDGYAKAFDYTTGQSNKYPKESLFNVRCVRHFE